MRGDLNSSKPQSFIFNTRNFYLGKVREKQKQDQESHGLVELESGAFLKWLIRMGAGILSICLLGR